MSGEPGNLDFWDTLPLADGWNQAVRECGDCTPATIAPTV